MKHRKMLLGTIVFTFLFAGSAFADPSVTQIRELSDVDLISGSSLFEMRGENGYYLADLEENPLTDAVYSSFSFEKGYITAYLKDGDLNREGLLLPDGSQVIECGYGDIKIANSHWAIGYKLTPADANNYDYEAWFTGEDDDKYFLIETADVYHLEDGAAALCASYPREEFLDYYAQGDYISIQNRSDESIVLYDGAFNVVSQDQSSLYSYPDDIVTGDYEIFSDNGQQGIRDKDGNVLVEPSYKYVDNISEGYARVSTGDYYGLIDLTGKVIVPAQADEIILSYKGPEMVSDSSYSGRYVCGGYVAASIDGKLAYYDLDGNQTVEPKISKDVFEVNGVSATYNDLEGNVHILAADGTDTVLDDAHKDVRALNYGSGYLYEFTDENYNKGLIDWHGNELLPIGQYSMELTGDGSYLLDEVDYSSSVLYEVNYGTQPDQT